jgi:hypothetical protein
MVFATPVTGPALLNTVTDMSVIIAKNIATEAIIIDLFVSNDFIVLHSTPSLIL